MLNGWMLLLSVLEKGNTYKIVKTKSEEKGSHERDLSISGRIICEL